MSLRMVVNDTDIAYDGGWQHVSRGTLIDCPPGSPMESAYGTQNLVDLDADAAAAAAAGAGASN